jgi:hypothetical protein
MRIFLNYLSFSVRVSVLFSVLSDEDAVDNVFRSSTWTSKSVLVSKDAGVHVFNDKTSFKVPFFCIVVEPKS